MKLYNQHYIKTTKLLKKPNIKKPMNKEIKFICGKCKTLYKDPKIAKECEEWCKEHCEPNPKLKEYKIDDTELPCSKC